MSTAWMPSPYGMPVIDAVSRTPTQNPVSIPGLMPLSVSPAFTGVPSVPLMAVQPPIAPFSVAQQPYSPFGVQAYPAPFPMIQQQPVFSPFAMQQPAYYPFGMPQPLSSLGMQPAVAAAAGIQPLPAHQMGMQPVQPIPQLGMQPPQAFPTWTPQHALVPSIGMPPAPLPIPGAGMAPISPITAMLLSQLGLREAAARIGDEGLKGRIITGVNEALDHTIDGLAGMTLQPWVGPGAQAMIYPIVSELALLAHRYPEGALRNDLLTIAGQILHKSTVPIAEGGGGKRR